MYIYIFICYDSHNSIIIFWILIKDCLIAIKIEHVHSFSESKNSKTSQNNAAQTVSQRAIISVSFRDEFNYEINAIYFIFASGKNKCSVWAFMRSTYIEMRWCVFVYDHKMKWMPQSHRPLSYRISSKIMNWCVPWLCN